MKGSSSLRNLDREQLLDALGAASLNVSGYCGLGAATFQRAMEIDMKGSVGRGSYERHGDDQSTDRGG